jgi:uncharacterized membrane protein YkoI
MMSMNRRLFCLAIFAGFLPMLVSPALADDNGGDGKDDSSSEGDDNNNAGEDDNGGHDDESGNSDKRSGEDHDEAKRAVDAHEAIPLDQMLAIFARRGTYTIIDVKLQRSNDTFLYVIKFIDQQTVRRSFFDARTGDLVK